MKCLILVAFSLVLLGFSEGQVALEILELNPDYPGKCVTKSKSGDLIVLDDGETKSSPDQCMGIECSVSDTQFMLTLTGCGKRNTPPGCKLVTNKTLPHPGCCRTEIVCP